MLPGTKGAGESDVRREEDEGGDGQDEEAGGRQEAAGSVDWKT